MSRRGLMAVVVLVLWAAGLAALTRRAYFQTEGDRLAINAQLVAPGAAYFAVERDGQPVGFLSSILDTTLAGVRIVDVAITGRRAAGTALTVRATTELTRSLLPLTYQASLSGGDLPLRLRAEAAGDTAVRVSVSSGDADAVPQHLATRAPAYSLTAVPLVFALGTQRRVDGRLPITVLDPLDLRPTDVVFRVTAESLFVVSDSAVFDEAQRRWVSVRQDTLRAWHLEPEGGAGPVSGWVDAAGRFVDATHASGFRLRRTSYEEAALNWRRAGAADSAAAVASGAPGGAGAR